MYKVLLLFSHKLTENQIFELKNNFKVDKVIYLDENMQKIWSNVDVDNDYQLNLDIIKKFLRETLDRGDYVLIQGEWGYTYQMVEFCKKNDFTPIYSFSKRESSEVKENEIVKKVSIFKHIKFIKY